MKQATFHRRNKSFVSKEGMMLFRIIVIFLPLILISLILTGSNLDQKIIHGSSQQRLSPKRTPVGLFTYNKWIDLNENKMAERNEFFGLGKEIFNYRDDLHAALYVPQIKKDTPLKIRFWRSTGELIRTLRHNYVAGRLFIISHIQQILPPGDFTLTINIQGSENTHKINFTLKKNNSIAKDTSQQEKPLLQGLHLITQWDDLDQDGEFDSNEVQRLSKNTIAPGKVEFAVCLKPPNPNQSIVFQTWDTLGNLLGMSIAHPSSIHYFQLKNDTTFETPRFLAPLRKASPGTYRIMAIMDNKQHTIFESPLRIGAPIIQKKDKKYPPTHPLRSTQTCITSHYKPKALEGFFVFADYFDLDGDSIQQKNEFLKLKHTSFNSNIENVHAQFHDPKYSDQQITLKILDQYGETIMENSTLYEASPQIFEISNTEFRLIPGQYTILIQPENSEEYFQSIITIQ